jgi:hypothetical protein
VRGTVERWLMAEVGEDESAQGLYAVIRAQGQAATFFGGAAYGLIFADEGAAARLAWVGGAGGITGLSSGCGRSSPAGMVRAGGTPPDFLLAPSVPEQLAPVD